MKHGLGSFDTMKKFFDVLGYHPAIHRFSRYRNKGTMHVTIETASLLVIGATYLMGDSDEEWTIIDIHEGKKIEGLSYQIARVYLRRF